MYIKLSKVSKVQKSFVRQLYWRKVITIMLTLFYYGNSNLQNMRSFVFQSFHRIRNL